MFRISEFNNSSISKIMITTKTTLNIRYNITKQLVYLNKIYNQS